MLNCTDVHELLSARLDGELGPAELPEVDVHLATCADCRELSADLQHVDRVLLDRPALPADPELAQRLCATLFAPAQPGRVVPLPLPPRPAVGNGGRFALVAVAAVAVAAVVMVSLRERAPRAPAIASASNASPAPAMSEAARVAARLRQEMDAVARDLSAIKEDVSKFRVEAAADAERSDKNVASKNVKSWK